MSLIISLPTPGKPPNQWYYLCLKTFSYIPIYFSPLISTIFRPINPKNVAFISIIFLIFYLYHPSVRPRLQHPLHSPLATTLYILRPILPRPENHHKRGNEITEKEGKGGTRSTAMAYWKQKGVSCYRQQITPLGG